MLNIYYARENIEKEKFIYRTIAARGYSAENPVIVIVPDQYTLEAEQQAFRWLETESLIGLDVYSMSHLGSVILEELGGTVEFVALEEDTRILTRESLDLIIELRSGNMQSLGHSADVEFVI